MAEAAKLAEQFWNRLSTTCVDDDRWSERQINGEITETELNAYGRERFGHDCIHCKKPWHKIDYSNRFGSISYFQPACTCFPVCPYCFRDLSYEIEMGLPGCLHCGFDRYNAAWRLHPCGSVMYSRKGEICNGFMRLENRHGDYKCDQCGRKAIITSKLEDLKIITIVPFGTEVFKITLAKIGKKYGDQVVIDILTKIAPPKKELTRVSA